MDISILHQKKREREKLWEKRHSNLCSIVHLKTLSLAQPIAVNIYEIIITFCNNFCYKYKIKAKCCHLLYVFVNKHHTYFAGFNWRLSSNVNHFPISHPKWEGIEKEQFKLLPLKLLIWKMYHRTFLLKQSKFIQYICLFNATLKRAFTFPVQII